MTNERDGVVHDFTHRRDVEHAEIVLPEGVNGGRLDPLYRGVLWNVAEFAEKRCDARTAREVEVTLPAELSAQVRRELAVGFGRELAQRYGVAVDVSIHAPHEWGDQRNHHAHLLMTTRKIEGVEIGKGGRVRLGEKAELELSDAQRKAKGLLSGAKEIDALRARWAELQNAALERAQERDRVDHRSYARRGLAITPTQHLGPAAAAQEREGIVTERGDLNRAALAEREARRELVLAREDLYQERLEQRERKALLAGKPEDEGLARQVEQDRRERLEHAVALTERRIERREGKARRREIQPTLITQAKRVKEWLRESLERVGEWVKEKVQQAKLALGWSASGVESAGEHTPDTRPAAGIDPARVAAGVEAFQEKFALRQRAEAGMEAFRERFERQQASQAAQQEKQKQQDPSRRRDQKLEPEHTPEHEPDKHPQRSRGRSRSRDYGPEL